MPIVKYDSYANVYRVVAPTVESRSDALDAEVARSDVPLEVRADVERVVRQASQSLGLSPVPTLRWLASDTANVRGVVFGDRLDELWVRVQSPSASRETSLHELKHLDQLRGGKYLELGLDTYELRQDDAEAFAKSWSATATLPAMSSGVEHKTLVVDGLSFKATDRREFSGYASRFGEVDYQNDVVQPGAFTATLQERASRPLLWSHDLAVPIGYELSLAEDQVGLKGTWRLSKTAQADDAYTLLKDGAVSGLSIGYIPRESQPGPDGTRELLSIDLMEISVVAVPALDSARVTAVKSRGSAAAPEPRIDIRMELLRRRSDRVRRGQERRRGTGLRV